MISISSLILNVLEGSTIASTEIYGADKKTYVNIGSGNVFNLTWTTPTLTNDVINYYKIVVKRYDTTLNVYYDILDRSVGLVNSFAVDSVMLPAAPDQYMLSVYVTAYGKQGSIVTSNIVNPYVSKGSGTYVKVEAGYKQPIMKRALALAKLSQTTAVELSDIKGKTLLDSEQRTLLALPGKTTTQVKLTDIAGKSLYDDQQRALYALSRNSTPTVNEEPLRDLNGKTLLDANGNDLFAEATKILVSTNGWQLMQESYVKAPNGEWRTADIKFEVLVDSTGAIITDSNNEPIYIL